ncbi:MAG: hypothetical protein ACI4JI_00705 [Ruminiclostridium sp.]
MIITGKNIENYFSSPRYIVFPRGRVFATFFFHGFIYHIAILLIYNVFAYIGVPVMACEVFHSVVFLSKLWRLMGYSTKLYYILFAVFTVANFLITIPERELIYNILGTYIF